MAVPNPEQNRSAHAQRDLKHANIEQAVLAYVERGSGPPVIFVHGALSDYRTWMPQLEAVAPRYRGIAYSRRCHYPNVSSAEAAGYSWERQLEDLTALLQLLDLGPVHLVGHSYGGALAFHMAQRHPEYVQSLVVGDPSVYSIFQLQAGARSLRDDQARGFEESLTLYDAGQQEAAVRAFLQAVIGMDVLDQLPPRDRDIVLDNAGTLGSTLRTPLEAAPFVLEDVRRLQVPVLLITGSQSLPVWRTICDTMEGALPNSRLTVLGGASHGLQIERPDLFNEVLIDFLDSLTGIYQQ